MSLISTYLYIYAYPNLFTWLVYLGMLVIFLELLQNTNLASLNVQVTQLNLEYWLVLQLAHELLNYSKNLNYNL